MIYFLNGNIRGKLSGLEHSAIRRLKLFKANGTEAKIVTAHFNPHLHENISKLGLQSNDILNMYDFFQHTVEYEEAEPETIDSLCQKAQCRYAQVGETDYKLYDQTDTQRMFVRCFPNSQRLNYVNHHDFKQKKVRRDFYDTRGFKRQERYLGDDQKVVHEVFYRPDGSVAIHKYYGQYSQEKSGVTLFELNYNGEIKFFRSEEDMIVFFLDCIVRASADSENILLCDKCSVNLNALVKMREKAVKIAFLHNNHMVATANGFRIGLGYQPISKNPKFLSAAVVSTEEQKKDFEADFGAKTPVFVIPAGFSQQREPRQADKVQKNKIINVARYSEEKRLDHLILAFDTIKDDFPGAELHLYGYGPVAVQLQALVDNKRLNDRVFLRGYLTNLEPEYNSADLFVFSSRSTEGLGLVLLEAASYGIPIVSYDIKYGPRAVIQDGVSGYLVKSGDIDELAAKMALLLSNEAQKKEFGARGRELAARFSEKTVWEKWRSLLELRMEPC